jgi:hypothetical protein
MGAEFSKVRWRRGSGSFERLETTSSLQKGLIAPRQPMFLRGLPSRPGQCSMITPGRKGKAPSGQRILGKHMTRSPPLIRSPEVLLVRSLAGGALRGVLVFFQDQLRES